MRYIPDLGEKDGFDYLRFEGGYDTETPAWDVPPGRLREAQNYEIGINGGYVDIEGYERFDGHTSPSDASYSIIDVTITGSVSVGDTITGAASGHTAVVLKVVTSETPNYLVVTKTTGTFNNGENLEVSATVEAVAASTATASSASTAALDAEYLNLAADNYRADISAITGSGNVLGVWWYSGVLYAFRNNAGGTAADMWKSSASGWTQVTLGLELDFTSGGTTEIAEDDVIEGAVSAATATVKRIVLESGTWAGGDAAGHFVLSGQTGTFQAENINIQGGASNVATIAGDSTQITLSPSGRYEFITHNFGGAAGEDRVYGVDGVNRAFEFDGTTYVPIDTGMATDTPEHIAAHKNHLFLSFGGSVQHSGIGTPYVWSPVLGAAELTTGRAVTAFQIEPGSQGDGTLAIFNENRVFILYGTSSSDWNLVPYRQEIGAYPYSVQQLSYTLFMDEHGLTNLRTAQEYGNFQHNTLSRSIQSFLTPELSLVQSSCVVRQKNQYRVFFSNNYALYVTMEGNTIKGMMPILTDHSVECMCSQEVSTGTERMFFGSDNGYVYEMDKGTSFDGAEIDAFLVFHFHHSGKPRITKRYFDVTLEAKGSAYAQFSLSYELGYGSTDLAQPTAQTKTLNFRQTLWDSFTWDAFYWDGVSLGPSRSVINGTAENISLVIRKNSDQYKPVLFTGALFRLMYRRKLR